MYREYYIILDISAEHINPTRVWPWRRWVCLARRNGSQITNAREVNAKLLPQAEDGQFSRGLHKVQWCLWRQALMLVAGVKL